MNISTKGGDKGETSLMFGRRVGKDCRRVCAYGALDELSAALGLARASCENSQFAEDILNVQKDLIKLMTELATAAEDFNKLLEKNITLLGEEDLARVESQIDKLEECGSAPKEWRIPGANQSEAALNLARTICRRAEREIVALDAEEPTPRKLPLVYLNRLADLIFLWCCKA